MAAMMIPGSDTQPLLRNLSQLANEFSSINPATAVQRYKDLGDLILETGELLRLEADRLGQRGMVKLWTAFQDGFVDPTDAKIQHAIGSISTLSRVVPICSILVMSPTDPFDESYIDPSTKTANSECSDHLSTCSKDSLPAAEDHED